MKKRTALLSSSSSSISSTSSGIASPIKKKPNKRVSALRAANAALADNSVTSPKSRSSIYRGVTRHRWTGRYEAHLWDKATWNSIQNKRGRQVYLGAYDNEDDAAQTYDLAALKYWGPTAVLNFAVDTYTDEIEKMSKMSKEEYLASLRRRSNGFSRGVSKYRGVARHHQNGRWEARIGRVSGNKYLYLGTYDTQEEAAAAYDMAAIEFRGANAVTNFDISNYADKLKKVIPEVEVKPVEVEVKPVEVEVKPVEVEVKKEKTTPSSSKGKKVIEMPNQPDQKKPAQPVQPTIPKIEPMGPVDSQPMVVMDPTEEHDHPWNLCMDADFNSLPIPDFPMENTMDFLGLFDDKCFDDDISFIFDGPLCDASLPEDAMSGNAECDNGIEQDVKGANVVTSPSPSLSLNTITSVCSNV